MYYFLDTKIADRSKMPHAAVHKSREKKRKGADAPQNEYIRRLRAFDEDKGDGIFVGRITKMLRFDRFLTSIYHPEKRSILEVEAAVVDRNIEKLKPDVGSLVIIVESGRKYEIYLPLRAIDAASRSDRIHDTILNSKSANQDDDVGIEFTYDDEEKKEETVATAGATGLVAKKDKVGKHTERVLREENDVTATNGADDDVNIDDI